MKIKAIIIIAPEKLNFIFNDGFCHVHKSIHREDVLKAKELYPDALVLAHPECTEDTLELADFIGSTSQIIDYARLLGIIYLSCVRKWGFSMS